jgi:two-component system response regulator GlrR
VTSGGKSASGTAPLGDSGRVWLDGSTVRARRYRLAVVSGPDAGTAMQLDGTLIVGSHPDAGLRLKDNTVSRYHLELRVLTEGVLLVDLDSSNGTLFAGNPIERMVVEREATLSVGRTSLRIWAVDESLGEAASERLHFGDARGRCDAMRRLFGLLERVAVTDSTVLLTGETGTGKEVLARGIHQESPRKAGPFVVVDCGAVAPALFESELFGHVKGAFTDALSTRTGAFVNADGGTLFLDEVGELPLELQPKLLRALESRTVRPLGDATERSADVRVVAATHRNLLEDIEAGRFRRDLYYRLAVVVAKVPPLRERLDDLPLLVEALLQQMKRADAALPDSLFERFRSHSWPGNVRELRNVLERALVEAELHADPTPAHPPAKQPGPEDLAALQFKEAKDLLVDAFSRDYIRALVERHAGNVSAVARAAGLNRNYVRELMTRYGVKPKTP